MISRLKADSSEIMALWEYLSFTQMFKCMTDERDDTAVSDSKCNSDYLSCDSEVPPVILLDALYSVDKFRLYLI